MERKFKIVSDPSTFVSILAFLLDLLDVILVPYDPFRLAFAEVSKKRAE